MAVADCLLRQECMTTILFAVIVLLAALLQTTSGFGFALLAMPVVTLVVGVRTAAPLVALTSFTLYAINLLRYRQALNWQAASRLAVACALGVPLGIWLVAAVHETLIKGALGGVLLIYGLYALLRPRLPALHAAFWVYPAGFVAGVLGGAYNTPGPPVIIYGAIQRWPKDEFRSILQALFLFSSALVIVSHIAAGHLTRLVWLHYAAGLPALLMGVGLGALVDTRLDNERFRRLITLMILLTGVLLIVQEL